MKPGVLLFDLIPALIDGQKMRRIYRTGLGRLMAARFGLDAATWETADAQIVADWPQYFADLNYSGDDGEADRREGLFRVTRALFRIANIPEPDQDTIHLLAQELLAQAPLAGDAAYLGVRPIVQQLSAIGIPIAILSYLPEIQVRAILQAAQILPDVAVPIFDADRTGRFDRDARYWQAVLFTLQLDPATCWLVTDSPDPIAAQLGLTVFVLEKRGDLTSLRQVITEEKD